MSKKATMYAKDCACDVAGCEVDAMHLRVEKDSAVAKMVAVFQPGPSCPKCHKPWAAK